MSWVDNPPNPGHPLVDFTYSSNNGGSWSTPIAFTGFSGGATPYSSSVQIAAEGTYVFLTWEQGGQTAYAISSNSGVTFNKVGLFTIPANLLGSMSGEAVSACGSYAYFTWADILTATSTKPIVFVQAHDPGTGVFSFSTPKALSSTYSAHEEDENACSGNYVYAVWDSIYFVVSPNNGVTWSSALQLSPGGVSGGLSREPMLSASGPNVYVTYPSSKTPDGSYQTFVVVNNNYGSPKSWSAPKDISYGYLTNTREVQVTSSGSNVYITTRGKSSTAGGTQQYVYVSTNNGATFTSPILLGPKLPNPENGFGGLAVDGSNVYVTWVHNAKSKGVQQIFFAASQDSGSTWANNQQMSASTGGVLGYGDPEGGQGPLIAANSGHVYVAWEDNSTGNGDIYLAGARHESEVLK